MRTGNEPRTTSNDPEKVFRERMARIEGLIDRLQAAGDPGLREAALETVRLLMELHGAGLRRMMKVVENGGEAARAITDGFARDELIGSVLLLYGLHPLDLETRVSRALDKVRPYLRSHGGGVELVAIREGAVHLRLQGSCKGCPSSAMTLRLAVEDAVYEAAPEVTEVLAEGSTNAPSQAHAGEGREPAAAPPGWEAVEGLAALADGAIQATEVGGRPIVFCRIGENYYAYAASCPGCNGAIGSGRIEGRNLVCPGCSRRYDILLAGRSVDDSDFQIEPLPLLVNDGRGRVALAAAQRLNETQGGL